MFTRVRRESKLRLHKLRHVRLGASFRVSFDDPGLLGEPISAGAALGGSLAHVVFHRHHLPRLVLPRELDPRHCRDVLRRTTEESRGRGSCRGRSHTSQSNFSKTQKSKNENNFLF